MQLPNKKDRQELANKAKEKELADALNKKTLEDLENKKKLEEHNQKIIEYKKRIVSQITYAINEGKTSCDFFFNKVWTLDTEALEKAIQSLTIENPEYTFKHAKGIEYRTDVNYETGNESNYVEDVIRVQVTWSNN